MSDLYVDGSLEFVKILPIEFQDSFEARGLILTLDAFKGKTGLWVFPKDKRVDIINYILDCEDVENFLFIKGKYSGKYLIDKQRASDIMLLEEKGINVEFSKEAFSWEDLLDYL